MSSWLQWIETNADPTNADFQAKLTPGIDRSKFKGVKVPVLRTYAKQFAKTEEAKTFLSTLPHDFFEENMLHGMLISLEKDVCVVLNELERFLPYVDNWAVCDTMRPTVFSKHIDLVENKALEWLHSNHDYTQRFGIEMLMNFCLDEHFKADHLLTIAAIRSDEYYVNMMKAWYFATALAKQWDDSIKILLQHELDSWSHNKTIQKAIESYRINEEQKAYLRTLKIR